MIESVEEHHMVLWMLAELAGLDPKDERFDARMTVVMENVRHHVEEEAQEWVPQVCSAMGRNRLVELGEQLAGAKSTAPRGPLKVPSAHAQQHGLAFVVREPVRHCRSGLLC